MELATSLADWTKCRFATGFVVFEDASRHALQRELVCLAITVAADNTWKTLHLYCMSMKRILNTQIISRDTITTENNGLLGHNAM